MQIMELQNRGATAPPKEVVRVRPTSTHSLPGGLSEFVGVDAASVRSKQITMSLLIVPGGAEGPVQSNEFEVAIYMIKGRVKALFGDGMMSSITGLAGDFFYVPAGVGYQLYNLSSSMHATAVIATTDSEPRGRDGSGGDLASEPDAGSAPFPADRCS